MSSLETTEEQTDVVIVGAGPAGLTLACDLARWGVSFKIVDKAEEPFRGSRGKGVQPRTLEIFDNLGAAAPLLAAGAEYPPMKLHISWLRLKWRMVPVHQPTPDIPYNSMWLVPQWRTEEVLRNRLAELGRSVEWGVEAVGIEQDSEKVVVQLRQHGLTRTLGARYVVGTDGGRSFVRKNLGVDFRGHTSENWRMIVGDVRVEGLARDAWHVWPRAKGGPVGLCPLPHSDLFQLMMKVGTSESDPELSERAVQQRWLDATGLTKIRLYDPTWLSLFRPNVRLVERYRVGRVFLAGDAAHVHTPAGAQGLNTGIQDAWNLGWKLALVIKGARESLLESYQEERMPVAAGVLELSSQLFKGLTGKGIPKLTRGDKERQLLLNYRSSSLSSQAGSDRSGKLQAGDRAPDAPCRQQSQPIRIFDVLRGPHFTVLTFGSKAIESLRSMHWRYHDLIRVVAILPTATAEDLAALIDDKQYARQAYGVGQNEDVTFLVRPDGYIGHIASSNWRLALEEYLGGRRGYCG